MADKLTEAMAIIEGLRDGAKEHGFTGMAAQCDKAISLLAIPRTAPADPGQAVAPHPLDHGLLQLTCEQLKARLAAAEAHIEKLEEVARQPQAAPVWTFKQRLDLGDVLDASGDVIATMYGKEGKAVVAAHNRCFAIQAAPEATSEQMGGAQVAKPDYSMPVDMSQAIRWIIQLRGRVDSLLAIINAPTQRAAEGEATERKPLTDTTHTAMLSACEELPEGYSIRIELEKGAGWVELHLPDGTNTHIEGEGYLSQDIVDALDAAIEQHHGITGGGK